MRRRGWRGCALISLIEEDYFLYYLFVFASLTRAQQGAKALNAAGLRAAVIKSPRGAAQGGCTHGVRVWPSQLEQAKQALAVSARPARTLFLVQPDGTVREVGL